jgi:hypothetical protein
MKQQACQWRCHPQEEITAMGVDPFTLYCYWAIKQDPVKKHTLTVYNRTEHISWQIEVDQHAESLYVQIGQGRGEGGCAFQVAIGMVVSNIVSVPPTGPSNQLDQAWCNTAEGASPEGQIAPADGVLSSFCLTQG